MSCLTIMTILNSRAGNQFLQKCTDVNTCLIFDVPHCAPTAARRVAPFVELPA